MKNTIRILFSILALSSTLILAAETPVDNDLNPVPNLNKFSYHGIGFKDSRADLESKHFKCDIQSCSRNENDTTIEVVFTGENIQNIEAKTRYGKRVDCEDSQPAIKRFLMDNFNFEPISKDSTYWFIKITSYDVFGNINTNHGNILVNVSCMNDIKSNIGYVTANFNLKDITYQNFKDAFKYE